MKFSWYILSRREARSSDHHWIDANWSDSDKQFGYIKDGLRKRKWINLKLTIWNSEFEIQNFRNSNFKFNKIWRLNLVWKSSASWLILNWACAFRLNTEQPKRFPSAFDLLIIHNFMPFVYIGNSKELNLLDLNSKSIQIKKVINHNGWVS